MKLKKTILQYRLHHILVWLLVSAIWFYLRYQDYALIETAIEVTLIKVIDLALMIYAANYYLIPKLLYKKRYILFSVCFISMIILSSMYKMQLIGYLTNNPSLQNISANWKARIYDNVIPHFFLVVAGVAFKLLFDQLSLQKRLTEIAKEKAEAELGLLKSQLNPHFLFNSINSVYFLIDKQNDEARSALHKFSEMLRYQLYECNGENIPIEKEIEYLKNYVDLQALRINKNCAVSFDCAADVKNFFIQPLLLIPFVENSFKHVSHYTNGKQNEVDIKISRNNGHMNFCISNTKEEQPTTIINSGGIGLNNVKKRLDLLYKDQHNLEVWEKDHRFMVNLTLSINSSL